ncbi:MAG: pyridoxamine 5'-phosphate oxidase [Alphaproteobacteria bacterium]
MNATSDDVRPFQEPFDRTAGWLEEAAAREPADPTAMCLATVDPDGRPSARMVLLKGFDPAGFVFYTNLESRKGSQLAGNPNCALCFHWKSLERQLRIEGVAEPVAAAEADAYFASRPRDSRIGAWASQQSRPLPDRFALEKQVARFAAKYAVGHVPRPPYWSGFRVVPQRIEFWQQKPFRLHDRAVYHRLSADSGWRHERLFP